MLAHSITTTLLGNTVASRAARTARPDYAAFLATLPRIRHEAPALERRLIVVCALARSARHHQLRTADGFIRNQAQEMTDAVDARLHLVVGPHDVPRRALEVGGLEHDVARVRVLVPLRMGREIQCAQFPLPAFVGQARDES